MTTALKAISQNKKVLILAFGLGLLLAFLPLQNTARAECDTNCADCLAQTECQSSGASCFWNETEGTCSSAGCVAAGGETIGDDYNWCPGCGWNPASWLSCFSCVVQSIFSLPVRFAFFLLAIVIGLFGLLSGFLFSVIVSLLNWMRQIFLEVPITPANQAMSSDFVVRAGWEFSRDFVNMLFILVLVFIGLATILKIRDYEAKKLLPTLIIIALLINFSAVIVGFVVDMGNIVTNFFLNQAGDYIGLGEIWQKSSTYLVDSMKAVFTLDGQFFENFGQTIGSFLGIIAYGLVMIIFYAFASIIYFIVFLIFFFRILILWVLTILAPLAFGAYILPATRKMFSEWWQQLIQWTIVGIPIGFFLWISNWIMKNTSALEAANLFDKSALESGLSCEFATLIGSILAPTIAIVMLGIGALMSMRMAPSGAQGIINWGKKAGVGAMKWGGLAAGTALGRKISPTVEKWGERLRGAGQKPLEGKGFWAKAGKYTGVSQVAKFGARQMGKGLEIGGREIAARIGTQDEAQIAESEKKAANRNPLDNINDARKALVKGDMNSFVGYLKGTIKNGDTDDIIDAVESGKLNWKDVAKAYKVSSARGTPHRRVFEKAFLGRMDQLGVSEENKAKIWDKITAQDLSGDIIASENLNPDSEMGQKVIDEMMLNGDSQLVSQMLRLKKKQRDPIWNYIKGKGTQWFINNGREDILRWSTSTAARGLGLGAIGGINPNQIDNMIIERDSLGKSNDVLKERLGNLKNELPSATKGNRGKILAETRRIENELALRNKGTDELLAEKIPHAAFIEQFDNMAPEKREVKDYEMNAQNREDLAKINRELKRRGIETSEFTPSSRPGEQPLAVQIVELREKENDLKQRIPNLYHAAKQKAQAELKQTVTRRKAVEKDFVRLPENIQAVERYVAGTESGIKEFDENIANAEKELSVAKKQEKETENWLAEIEAGKIEATEEALETRRKRLTAIKNRREGLETTIKNATIERNEEQGLATKYRNMWKGMAAGEKVQPIEVIIKDELGGAIKTEKQAEDNLAKVKVSRETKQIIDAAQEKLNTASQKRNFLEGELASQLRVTHLASRVNKFNKDRGRIEDLEKNISAVGTDVSETEKTIKNNLTGKGGLRRVIGRIKEIKDDIEIKKKEAAERIRPQIETEQLRLHPEMKQVPRDFLSRILKEEAEKDSTVQALKAQRESAERKARELRQQIRSEQESLGKFKQEQTKSQKEYDALMRLTGGKERLGKAITRGEKEIDDILGRKITPKLPNKERRKLEKSS